jgi:PAS domain S-box-containing protein
MPADIEALTPLPEEIADALPAMIIYIDADRRFGFANRAYQEWFGRSLDDIRGRPFRDVVGEAAFREVEPYMEAALRGETISFEATVRNAARVPRRIEGRYVPSRGADGQVVGYYAIISDRTERDQTARLETILDGISDGFCSFDHRWRLAYCNQAAERHLGVQRAEALGKTYQEIAPSVVGSPLDAALQAFGADQARLDIESEDLAPGKVLAISVFSLEHNFALSFRDVTIRNAAIKRAREQEQRLQLAMSASGLGDWSWDPVTDVMNLSPRAAEIFGLDAGAVITRAAMQAMLHADDRASIKVLVDQAIAKHENYEVEYRVQRPDGDWAWVLALGQATYDADGAVTGMVGVLGDISRSKAGEAALRESEARFRAMAEAAPAPVWVTSATGAMEYVNKAFADFAGRPREELLGDGWTSLIHPEDLPEVAQRRAVARAKLEPYDFEARFQSGDGKAKIIQASSQPWFDAAGSFQGYVGLANDLTEIRHAEDALRESEQRFRLVAEDAPVMLWMSDTQGAYIYLNRMLREFWGAPENLSEFDWRTRLVADDLAEVEAAVRPAILRQEPFTVEARYYRADGEVRGFLTRAKPRFEADGTFLGMIGVNADVTEVRRFQAHQQLLINELNHRVKNTLATVQSIAHQTLQSEKLTRDAREQFTDRLLALSAAHNVLTRQSWGGAPMLEIVAEAIRPYEDAAEPRVTLQGPAVRLAPNIALALSMALHELATNALKYGAFSTREGRVSLTWSLDAAASQVAIEWREEGGPAVTAPTKLGFGTRLLQQGLATELGAAAVFDYATTGLVCTFKAPIQSALSPDPIA